MATINADLPTLADLAKLQDPDGSHAKVVEMLTRKNAFLPDMVWKEGNLPTGHRITSESVLPTVGYRQYNEGVAASKGRTSQADETCGMLEGISKVDRDLARLNGNEAAYRLSQDKMFMRSMNNAVEDGILYNSVATNQERFHGIIPRLASTTGIAGSQIVLAEADDTGVDYTTALIVGWGPNSVYGIYPKGSKQGLETIDMGLQLTADANSREFLAWVTNFKWQLGVAVEDWRYLAAVRNIDSGNLSATDDLLVPKLIEALYKLESLEGVRPVIYVNRKVNTYLHLQARNTAKSSMLSVEMPEGKPVVHLMGVPIRMTDALTITEDGIS
jgi:hypothetical protein